ncbi:hypothetical protein [Neorhizobium petrolearium]|uniref:hypothetical protein n=1 Tax=Neorhizobium petrolearium TaxID=515361 RepID=UPI003F143E36
MENPNDDGTYVFEPAVIKLTPYDRRLKELRDLQAKREVLLTQPDNQRQLAALDYKLQEAQKRFDKETKRSTDDAWRWRRNIDAWRAGEGRERRNESRRKVRTVANEDCSHLTPKQKEDRKRGQRADRNFIKRRTEEGMSEADIQIALALRQQARAAKIAAQEPLNENPAFGMF